MTPIILLHHNEIDFLEKSINSIIKNTKSKYEIIIVDNCSSIKNVEILKNKYSKKFKVIFNKKDNWVFGFNLGIKSIKYSWNRIVLSDADIVFKKYFARFEPMKPFIPVIKTFLFFQKFFELFIGNF